MPLTFTSSKNHDESALLNILFLLVSFGVLNFWVYLTSAVRNEVLL